MKGTLESNAFFPGHVVLDKFPSSREEEVATMPKFIDSHPMKPFTAEELNKLQDAPPDEFGVTHHDILFSEKDNKIYCVLDAPSIEAIEKHHAKAGIKCEHIHEVRSTRG